MGELRSDMEALTWGGKLWEAVLCPTGGCESATAAERPASTASTLARRRVASGASSRSRRAAADSPDVLEGGAFAIRRRKAEKRPRKECMGAMEAMGVAGPTPRAASA